MENRKVNILGTEYKIIYGNCKEIPELKEMVDWFAIQSSNIFKVFQELDIL